MVNSGYRRADRVEVSVQRALSEILTRELPQELPSLVTVTAVRRALICATPTCLLRPCRMIRTLLRGRSLSFWK